MNWYASFTLIVVGVLAASNLWAESIDNIQSAIEARRAAAIAAYNAADVDAMVSNYTEDTWHISPRRPPVQGREALKAYFAPAMKSYLSSPTSP